MVTSSQAFNYAYYGYKTFQAGRLACGDVSALAEIIVEASGEELSRDMAREMASSVWDAYGSSKDFKKACKEMSRRKCSSCGYIGHNKRTCKGWLRESIFGH